MRFPGKLASEDASVALIRAGDQIFFSSRSFMYTAGEGVTLCLYKLGVYKRDALLLMYYQNCIRSGTLICDLVKISFKISHFLMRLKANGDNAREKSCSILFFRLSSPPSYTRSSAKLRTRSIPTRMVQSKQECDKAEYDIRLFCEWWRIRIHVRAGIHIYVRMPARV